MALKPKDGAPAAAAPPAKDKKPAKAKKKTAKAAAAKAAAAKAAASTGTEYTVTLQHRHAIWLENTAAMYGRTPAHQIEKLLREAYATDPNRSSGATAVKDSGHHEALLARR